MKGMAWPAGLLLVLVTCAPVCAGSGLQVFVNLTPIGKTLTLPPGVYSGPLVIDKPIIFDGKGEVTIDGQGEGTVLIIEAAGAIVRNLHLTGSGDSHDGVDAGVLITTDDVLLENNVIDSVLFGVHIQQGNNNTVRNNTISSVEAEGALRGDGIRLWYSRGNLIEGNQVTGVRDLVFQNSIGNRIIGNSVIDSRMGMEFIFAPGNIITGNRLSGNEHGIVAIYSDELQIRENRIEHQSHLLGSAVAVKGSSQVQIADNEFLDCVIGLTANSPTFPENILYIRGNHFAYNDVAMYFYGDRGGHVIHGNSFQGNFQQVAVTAASSAIDNDWRGNTWQDYDGFDRDGDGIGDTPYSLYLYSDRLWMDRPMAKFFRGSPVLETLDFVERLISFSEPELILQDPAPLVR